MFDYFKYCYFLDFNLKSYYKIIAFKILICYTNYAKQVICPN